MRAICRITTFIITAFLVAMLIEGNFPFWAFVIIGGIIGISASHGWKD